MPIVDKITFNERVTDAETCTIASGQQASTPIGLHGGTLLSFQTPAAWTANDASLQGSIDGVYYTPIVDSAGNAYTWTTAASQGFQIHPTITAGFRFIKIISGLAQTGTRVIILGIRQVV